MLNTSSTNLRLFSHYTGVVFIQDYTVLKGGIKAENQRFKPVACNITFCACV